MAVGGGRVLRPDKNDVRCVEKLVERARSGPLTEKRGYGLVLEADFKAYTPYMGGGFDTSTWKELSNGAAYLAGFPTAKQVAGRMRWLAKVALVGRNDIEDFRDAETKPVHTIRLRDDKTCKAGLVQVLFGFTPAQGGECSWRGLVKVIVKPLPPARLIHSNWLDVVDKDFIMARKRWNKKKKRFERNPLLPNNRFQLLRMGKKDDKEIPKGAGLVLHETFWGDRGELSLEPIRADALAFRLEVLLDRSRLDQVSGLQDSVESVVDFVALLSLLTPTLVGLGKAVNRGFGRFVLVGGPRYPDGSRLTGEAVEILRRLSSACKTSCILCESCFKRLVELLNEAAGKLAGPVSGKLHAAPSLGLARVRVVGAKLDKPTQPGGVTPKPVNLAIDKIGMASTKMRWKRLLFGENAHSKPGLMFHTWPLGLPRSQKFPGKCRESNQQDCIKMIRGKPKFDGSLMKTGYLIVESGVLKRKDCIGCGDEARSKYGCKPAKEYRQYIEEGRRQSMIIAFPAPLSLANEGVDPERWPVVVLLLPARDYMDELFKEGTRRRLYHSGPCDVKNSNKPCLTVMVDVAHATLGGGCRISCDDYECLKEGGAATPPALGGTVVRRVNLCDESSYSRVLEDALEFFVEVLGS